MESGNKLCVRKEGLPSVPVQASGGISNKYTVLEI